MEESFTQGEIREGGIHTHKKEHNEEERGIEGLSFRRTAFTSRQHFDFRKIYTESQRMRVSVYRV